MTKKRWFKLFACCIIVNGESNSLIYDIQRNHFYELQNDYLDILKLSEKYDISSLSLFLGFQEAVVSEFFNKFIMDELGFLTDTPEMFPDLDLYWDSPYTLTNSIVEIADFSDYDVLDVLAQLNKIGCQALQLRTLSSSLENIKHYLSEFNNSRTRHIELIMPFENAITNEQLSELMVFQPRLHRISLFGYPEDKILMEDKMNSKAIIGFAKDILKDEREIIKKERFKTNIESFTEAQNHNLGLNRKVCINKFGEIKNYLSHTESFGDVRHSKIKDVIQDERFRTVWFINTDKIEGCKDCQYRYTCINNSPITLIDSKYYLDVPCSFQPNTNQWEETKVI